MAKTQTGAMKLQETFSEFKESKNIDQTTLLGVLEESFRNVIAKIFGSDENFDVIVNPAKGDFEIYRNREVVADGDVTDPNKQISLTEAHKIEDDYEVGEEVSEPINFASFGRRAILTLRQTLQSKILELEHEDLYNTYKEREGELVTGEVYQIWKSEILLLDDAGNELLLPKNQQIPRDFYHKGDLISAVIDRVDNSNGAPKIYLSRTSPVFMQRLLEREIPELGDGMIRIRAVARIPGERAKIAVESYDDHIDPVGACVGMKGSRIMGVVKELHNESIDVIQYSANDEIFIARALSLKAEHVVSMELDAEHKRAEIVLEAEQVRTAIGKSGLNIKLASMLTGYTIDVFRNTGNTESEDDIYLDEFNDEIDQWVIDAVKALGYETARDVLSAPREELIEKADLEEDTVDNLLDVLKNELENG